MIQQELPHSPDPNGTSEQRLERLIDQGVFDPATAKAVVFGEWAETPPTPVIPKQHLPGRSHASRRGGRSFPEPSDSELDENWNVTNLGPLSEEQKAINERGIALVHRALATHKFDEEVRIAHERGIPVMALQRARAERAERERSGNR